MGSPAEETDDALESVLDLLVYAPIGFLLDAKEVQPDLAARGRMHTKVARQIGEMAVTAGIHKVDGLISRLGPDTKDESSEQPPPPAAKAKPEADTTETNSVAAKKKTQAKKAGSKKATSAKAAEPKKAAKSTKTAKSNKTAESNKAAGLAIPDYDSLAASQVVKRLDSLTKAQLKAVHAHESANRGRRTVLTKIARLQDSA